MLLVSTIWRLYAEYRILVQYIGIVHLSKRVQQLSSQRCVSLSDLHFRCMTNLIILYTPKEKMYALYRRSTKFFCCPNMCLSHFSNSIKERTQRSTRTKKKKITEYSIYTTALHNTYTRITIQYIRRIPPSKQRKFSENLQSIISRRYI